MTVNSPTDLNSSRTQAGPRGLFGRMVSKSGGSLPDPCPGNGRTLVFFLIEIQDFQVLHRFLGKIFVKEAAAALESKLLETLESIWGGNESSSIEEIDDGRYLLHSCVSDFNSMRLPEQALAIRLSLVNFLRSGVFRNNGQFLSLRVGFSSLSRTTGIGLEKDIKRAVFDAQRAAIGEMEGPKLGLLLKFRKILAEERLSICYQPVIDLESGEILGWEALVRGPEGSPFQNPDWLFAFAEDAGESLALDQMCRKAAVRRFGAKIPGQKIFINVHQASLADPKYLTDDFVNFLLESGFSPADIILEFSSLDIVRDFPLAQRVIENCRHSGFKVALDNFGPGLMELHALAEIRPKFVKLAMSLVHGAQVDPVKQALVETYATFANRIGSELIAVGIESKAELDILTFRGVRHGQGSHLAQPAYPKTVPDMDVVLGSLFSRKMASGERMCSIPVGALAEPTCFVSPDTSVDVVRQAMNDSHEPLMAVAVVEDDRPLGLVMSHHLNRHLSEEFGRSVYFKRPVTLIMDSWPLIVEASTPVELAARQALLRNKQNIFDYVIVTESGRFKGVVSVQKMLDALAEVQVEMAKGASPLTGLPGNLLIEQEIERRAAGKTSFAIIYADLDNFKVYNDIYGFVHGDDIILLLGRIMAWAMKRHGAKGDFLGHVGGDDFVILTSPCLAERICQSVARVFGRLVTRHFTPADLARGFVRGKDRRGQEMNFPLTTVSLGILECAPGTDLLAIAQSSSATKTFAKTIPGNSYVYDRRNPKAHAMAEACRLEEGGGTRALTGPNKQEART